MRHIACPRCRSERTIASFRRHTKWKGGEETICKVCRDELGAGSLTVTQATVAAALASIVPTTQIPDEVVLPDPKTLPLGYLALCVLEAHARKEILVGALELRAIPIDLGKAKA